MLEIKNIFSVVAAILGVVGFLPYLRDVYRGITKPHVYTWFVWLITQSIAIAAAFRGGGGLILNLAVGLFFMFIIFLLSFKKGTKNITKSDTVVLVSALVAIVVYFQLDKPLLAVIMVSLIDFLGYIPTFRKTFEEPWSETVGTWAVFVVSNILAIVALQEYNFLTVTYLVTITTANAIITAICLIRKKYVTQPAQQTN